MKQIISDGFRFILLVALGVGIFFAFGLSPAKESKYEKYIVCLAQAGDIAILQFPETISDCNGGTAFEVKMNIVEETLVEPQLEESEVKE